MGCRKDSQGEQRGAPRRDYKKGEDEDLGEEQGLQSPLAEEVEADGPQASRSDGQTGFGWEEGPPLPAAWRGRWGSVLGKQLPPPGKWGLEIVVWGNVGREPS